MSRFVLTAQLQLQAPTNTAQVVRQIQSQLNNVQVNVQVQGTAQATRQVNQVAQSINAANSAASNLGRTFAISVRRFTALAVATRAVSLFTNTLANATEEAIQFERELIRISQVTGKTVNNLRDLTKTITSLSTGLGVSSTSLIGVSRILSQAGFNAKETEIALRTLAKTELAPTFDDITETAEGAVAIFNQFKLGAEALEEQLGSINAVAGRFAVEAGDLIGVVRRAGGVFKASGGDLNELIALFTSVRATTRESAESIATGLRTIFTRIQRPKTIEFLKQYGIELVDLEGKFVGPFEATKRLSAALAGLEQGDITFVRIAEELGGFRQIGKVIPLLQQFQVAQEALNVAQKGSSSLAKDAESAQAALAVRITKVKEEFLALVRSITETSSFQLFANTALNLASALIKLADALKPIIPLLTAVATIKLAQGVSSFIGGFGRGIGSGRTFNQGGKVLKFARGGMVPGSGNRDTVPAMLQPGEFVIRKSSVNKLGASNLAAMNENRYAIGGKVGGISLAPVDGRQSGQGSVSVNDVITSLLKNTNLPGGISGNQRVFEGLESSKLAKNIIQRVGGFSSPAPKSSRDFIAEGYGFPSAKAESQLQDNLSSALSDLIAGAAKELGNSVGVAASSSVSPQIIQSIGTADILGKVFEGSLNLLGAPFDNLEVKQNRDAFDFPSGLGSKLGSYFTELANIPTDAKRTLNKNILDDIASKKVKNLIAGQVNSDPEFISLKQQKLASLSTSKKVKQAHFGGQIQKFAKGGKSLVQKGQQLGGVGIFDSDKIAGGTNVKKALLEQIKASKKPYQVISGPAGSGKTTFAVSRFGSNFILSAADLSKYSRFAILSGAGKTKTGDFSDDVKSLLSGASGVTVLKPDQERLMKQRQGRLDSAMSGNLSDERSVGALQGTLKAPTDSNEELFKKYANVQVLSEYAKGGGVGTDTVPALLTPGEFVINKKSAQAIGYGSLNRMNKVGKYAKGGVVQNFATGGSVTSKSVASKVSGLADNKVLQNEIVATAQEIKKTGSYAKILTQSIDKQSKITNSLYQESASLDAKVKRYAAELDRLAVQQGKAVATGTAANRIVQLRAAAETKRIEIDNKAISEDQKLEGIKKKYSTTIEKQTQLTEKQNALIQQAKSNKQAATQLVQSSLVGGKQSNFSQFDTEATRQQAYAQARVNNKARQSQRSGGFFGGSGGPMSGKDIGMMAIGLTSVTAALQSMLPPLDENSSAFTKLAHSSLSLVTQIGAAVFALNTFGITLNKQSAMNFLSGKGLSVGGKRGVLGAAQNLGFSRNSSVAIMKSVNAISKLAGPTLAVVGASLAAASAFRTIYDSIYDFDNRLKKSIEKGDVEGAKRVAEEKAAANNSFTSGKSLGTVAASTAAGAAVGSVIPVIGTVLGGLIGFGIGLAVVVSGMTTTSESAIALAASQAGAVAAQNALNKAQNVATESMDKFNKGTLSAAEALAEIRNATKEVEVQEKRASDFATKNVQNRSEFGRGAALRNIGALGGLNPFMETSWARNTRLGEESAGQIKEASRLESERFKLESPARQAAVRSAAARGINIEATKQQQTGGLQARANELAKLASTLRDAGDNDGAEAAQAAMTQLANQVNQTNKEIENMYNEVKRAREAFDAMNLGLRSASATATGASATLTRFANSLQVGGSTLVSDVEFLSTAMTSAAQAMNPDDIRSAINNVAGTLEKFGVSEKFVDKFKSNTETFVKAQQNYASSVKAVIEKNKAAGTTNVSPEKFQDQIAEELTKGLDKEAADNLKKVIGGIQLDQSEIDEFFRTGDVSAFGDKLSEATKKQFEEITKIAQELQKAESVLIDLTKKRIDAERNLVQAQKEAIDLYMEGRDIQASAGGPSVTAQERRGAILRKANVELAGAGLSDIGQAGAGDFRAINREMLNRTAEFQTKASTEGGLQGVEGTKAAEQQANLQKAYKSQIETVRALVKLEQDELKLIKEKNNLEKSSIDALISGDIDKFFEQQAAVGAQAAIATGSSTLQNAFGASALGAAAQETRRLQESGVQELYGQRLAGPGGLTERAFGAALGGMGVDNQRMARVAAGTTAEENDANARLRELGGVLGELGGVGEAMATMEVASATMNVQNAEIKLQDVIDRGNAAAERAGGMYRGGVVYANRGMFVPRGTDTVPAMLTPGEFVVRRQAVQRGNNLQILQAMNRGGATQSSASGSIGMANGGPVRYRQNGSNGPESGGAGFGISPEIVNRLSQSLDKFNTDLSSNIDKLNNTTFNVKLDSTNINVNLTGTSFLSKLTEDLKSDLYKFVGQEIQSYGVDNGGKLKRKSGPIA